MSEFKGTKGKWGVYNNATTRKGKLGIVISWNENGRNPIEVCSTFTSEAQANALLISKAPEMLEMLQKCKEYFLLKTDKYSEERADAIGQLIKEATEV